MKLEAGECYVRPRASSSSSDVWALFQEVAYKDTHFFTGIVQCKSCKFFTRYHGQITGTSHMRRHHCFSLLFPNSVPATRKAKNAAAAAANGGSASSTSGLDADSTTPRMMAKKMKKDAAVAAAAAAQSLSSPMRSIKSEPMDFSSYTQLAMSAMNGPAAVLTAAAAAAAHANASANGHAMNLHSANLPKKRLKNGGAGGHHYMGGQERSLINGGGSANASSATLLTSMAQSIASGNNSMVNSIVNSFATSQHQQQQQSMLRPMGNNNNSHNNNANSSTSPGSSPHHNQHNQNSNNNAASQHQQMLSQLNQLSVPSTVTNNLRIQNAKQDLRERLVAFCAQELVPIATVNSEAFRAVLQSHLRLCTTQLQQQLTAQQQAQAQQNQSFPQLISLTSMVTSFMNHLSHQMPDGEQLQAHLKTLHGQCRERIRTDLNRCLETNIGGALVCDSEADACIFSAYYIDESWRLVEAVLGASAAVTDINLFISGTLASYALQDGKKLSKFTFVSHGGLFDGVSLSLCSMAHTVDKVVEEAMLAADELFARRKTGAPLPLLGELLEEAAELASKCNLIPPPPSKPSSDVEWIAKVEAARAVLTHRKVFSEVETGLNFDLLSELLKLLHPFLTASVELRQCFQHPTLSHVLLYYYKLKKVLASNSSYSALMRLQTEPTNLSTKVATTTSTNKVAATASAKSSSAVSAKVNGVTSPSSSSSSSSSSSPTSSTCPVPPKKAKRARSFETMNNASEQSAVVATATALSADENSDEEKEIEDCVSQTKLRKTAGEDDAATTTSIIGKAGVNGGKSDDEEVKVDAKVVEEADDDEEEPEEEEDEEEEIELLDPGMQTMWMLDQLKKTLLDNLTRHYEVQTLHRIATFLWPNFRFLKMLTSVEQKEVHEEVRKMLQLREVTSNGRTDALPPNGHGGLFGGVSVAGGGSSSSASSGGDSNSGIGKVNGSKNKSTDFDEWEVLSDHDQDEVDKYLSVQLTSCSEDNVLQWWREHSAEFPKLSQLAKWILAIPASVTTRERFKVGGAATRSVDDMMLFLHCNM